MKLFWGPHTCALGIHLLLEEVGKPYETEKIDVVGGQGEGDAFRRVNPKGKVPTLVRDDGSVLTEFGAIATWLARTNPDKHLLPGDVEREVRALEIMDYAVATLHMQGFARIFKPAKFEPPDVVHSTLGLGGGAVKKQGEAMVREGFGILDAALAGRPFAGGDALSVADAALFYCERWAPQVAIPLPPAIQAHFERMLARPAVQRAMAAEGERVA